MKDYLKPLRLGDLELPINILYAPLAGCSDYPFRKMSAMYRPGLFFCEMVKMDALIRHDPNTYRYLDYDKDMHPIGAQLCGSKPHLAGDSAKIIEDLGFDVIDLNCGCPVDKVTKDGSGSGLLKNPDLIGEILFQMIKNVSIPVTVKIRAGWDSQDIVAHQITKIAEAAGAKAITIHGRTRAQGYKGPANWDYIKMAKDAAKDILVIGNGDIKDGPSAKAMMDHTGCDGILVGRSTMGKPWIVQDIIDFFSQGFVDEKPVTFYRDVFLKHFQIILDYENESRSILNLRRVGSWYLKNAYGIKKLRESLNRSKSLAEITTIIKDFDWTDAQFNVALEEAEDDRVSCDC